jgi:hypothetical protein
MSRMKRALSAVLLMTAVLFAVNALSAEKVEMKAEKKPVTLKGELVDTGCYIGHGAMGEKHKECATKCIANGMPMGLLSGKTLYLVTMNHDNPDAYNKLKDMAGQMVEVTGMVAERNGVKAIDVTDTKLAAAAATK